MSRFITRALLIACLAGSATVFADDDNDTPPVPLQSDEATGVEEEEVAEEPGRLREGVDYYNGAEEVHPGQAQANLFYNFYATPGMPAAMYPAPFPTPANIGHTYYTYQPFMPHEFLYPHARTYYTYHGNYHGYHHLHGGSTINRTSVRWQVGHGMRPFYPVRLHNRPCVPGIPVQAHH
jgi:hypothetical protein